MKGMMGTIDVTIYIHSRIWNLLPYVEIELPSIKRRGWRLSLGWLCVSMEMEKRN